jgi:hypothetical protein
MRTTRNLTLSHGRLRKPAEGYGKLRKFIFFVSTVSRKEKLNRES